MRLLPAFVVPALLLAAHSASAQDWRVTLGGGALLTPSYLGSDDYDIDPLPVVDLRYRDLFFLSTRDGLGANLLHRGGLTAGPVVKYRSGRDQDDDDALRGLGDVDPAGEAGAFIRYKVGLLALGAELRQGFGGHEGLVADFAATRSFVLDEKLRLNVGPTLTLASSDFTETYFGIDAGQAARSGYDAYDADGIFVSYGIGTSLGYQLTRQLSLGLFAGIDRIAGDAADSPIVDEEGSATQARVGLSVSYSFGW